MLTSSTSVSPPVAAAFVASRTWRRDLYVIVAAQFVAFVAFNLVIPFLPLFIQQLGVSDPREVSALAGMQQTCSSVGLALCSPIWGTLGDRFGRKSMLLRAVALGACTIVFTAFVGDIWQLFLARFLMGALTGVQGPAMALASSLVPRARTGYAVGMIQMAGYSGAFVGPLVGGLLADAFGFRLTFIAGGVLMACIAAAIFGLVHETFVPQAPAVARSRDLLKGLRELIAGGRLTLPLLTIFCISFSIYGIPPMMPLFVQQLPNIGGSTATITGLILATAGLCSALSAPLLGRVGPRLGYERILMGAALAASAAAASIVLMHTLPPLVASEALMGLAVGGLLPVAFTLVSLRAPRERQGSIYGLTSSSSATGQAIGPLAAGLLASAVGVRPVFLLPAAMLLVVMLLAFTVRRSASGSS